MWPFHAAVCSVEERERREREEREREEREEREVVKSSHSVSYSVTGDWVSVFSAVKNVIPVYLYMSRYTECS